MMSRWAPWWSGIRHTHIHTYIHTQTHIREVHDNFLEFQMTIWSCSFWLKFFSVHFWTQNLRRMCCKSYLLDIIRISKSIFYTDYLSVASRVSKHKIWCAIRMFCLLFQTRIDHRTSDATGTHSTSCGNSGSTNMFHQYEALLIQYEAQYEALLIQYEALLIGHKFLLILILYISKEPHIVRKLGPVQNNKMNLSEHTRLNKYIHTNKHAHTHSTWSPTMMRRWAPWWSGITHIQTHINTYQHTHTQTSTHIYIQIHTHAHTRNTWSPTMMSRCVPWWSGIRHAGSTAWVASSIMTVGCVCVYLCVRVYIYIYMCVYV